MLSPSDLQVLSKASLRASCLRAAHSRVGFHLRLDPSTPLTTLRRRFADSTSAPCATGTYHNLQSTLSRLSKLHANDRMLHSISASSTVKLGLAVNPTRPPCCRPSTKTASGQQFTIRHIPPASSPSRSCQSPPQRLSLCLQFIIHITPTPPIVMTTIRPSPALMTTSEIPPTD